MIAETPDPKRRALALAGLAGAPAWLVGCSLPGAPRQEFHLLRDAGTGGASGTGTPPRPRIDKVLLVAAHAPAALYGGDRMVYSADGHSRSYFQFGFWGERPAQTLQALAISRLAQAQRFSEVASSTAGVRGDLLLTLRLDELYLDASAEPGQVRLIVGVELVDWRQRSLLARGRFERSRAAPTHDAAGFAAAASAALGSLLDELIVWVATAAAA